VFLAIVPLFEADPRHSLQIFFANGRFFRLPECSRNYGWYAGMRCFLFDRIPGHWHNVRYLSLQKLQRGPMKSLTTLNEDVYKRLKTMIVRRELAPGSKLVLRNVAKQLGTSTMPVVEAIRRLEHDGLVTQIPKWGAFVKEWTAEEQVEAIHIRRALEGEAARLFVLRASEQSKRDLVELNEGFDRAATLDVLAGLEADVALHLHIARSTGFPRLALLIEISKIPLAMIMKSGPNSGSRGSGLNEVGCHARLVHVLLGGDPDLAMQAMWEHVDGTMRVVRQKHSNIETYAGTREGAGLHT
jgi:DNA-binding GntR family transcriptional regulator